MRPWLLTLVLALASGGLGADLPEAYQVIARRNLFSPSRVATPPPTAATVVAPPPPAETITLSGVAVLDGQATALFTGSTASLSGACRPGESLGPLRVITVSTGGVSVDAGGQGGALCLAVGQSLRHLQGQPWQWSATAADGATPVPPASSSSAATPPPASTPAGDTDAILKRLLERRKKEMNP
jgi:hypothetical protein